MKAIIAVCSIAVLVAVPAVSFGQTNSGPLTRAQVRAQLIQLERAGYNPATANKTQYPRGIQAAEARIQAQGGTQSAATGVGGTTSSAASGHPMSRSIDSPAWHSMYGRH